MGIWQVWDLRGYLLLSIVHKIGDSPSHPGTKLQSTQVVQQLPSSFKADPKAQSLLTNRPAIGPTHYPPCRRKQTC